VLETLSYAITLAYSFRHEFPFSTYGENLFLTLQNTIITLLIIYHSPARVLTGSSPSKSQKITSAALLSLVLAFGLYIMPTELLSLLQVTTLPLSLFSKLPQIRQNARAESTGQLSAFAVISQIAGCLARLFTTATEVGDSLVSAGFALALLLNIVLGAQLYMYWGQGDIKDEFGLREEYKVKEEETYPPAAWESSAPTYHQPARVPTPPLRTPTSVGGRKWARKVD
jgi:mannose-P-dolichol utilization defect protein 1